MYISLIASTAFAAETAKRVTGGWEADTSAAPGEALVEFAGRACYQSWDKPNPATATNEKYLAHLIRQGHGSVYEHAVVTFYFTGVSRSFTHELIRHRHFSYSELSQRYVDMENAPWVMHPVRFDDDAEAASLVQDVVTLSRQVYQKLTDRYLLQGRRRKQAREAAREIITNNTETRIVVTGNIRAWRHFLAMRGTAQADQEMCRVAVEVGRQLSEHLPSMFQDMRIVTEDDQEVIFFEPL